VLERILVDNIAAIHANRVTVDTTPELVADTVKMRRSPNLSIYMALYPASEYEIVTDDGEDPEPG